VLKAWKTGYDAEKSRDYYINQPKADKVFQNVVRISLDAGLSCDFSSIPPLYID
jgi:hypothetical protein